MGFAKLAIMAIANAQPLLFPLMDHLAATRKDKEDLIGNIMEMIAGGNAGGVGAFDDAVGIIGSNFADDIALPASKIMENGGF